MPLFQRFSITQRPRPSTNRGLSPTDISNQSPAFLQKPLTNDRRRRYWSCHLLVIDSTKSKSIQRQENIRVEHDPPRILFPFLPYFLSLSSLFFRGMFSGRAVMMEEYGNRLRKLSQWIKYYPREIFVFVKPTPLPFFERLSLVGPVTWKIQCHRPRTTTFNMLFPTTCIITCSFSYSYELVSSYQFVLVISKQRMVWQVNDVEQN